jgi:glycosyltransferase involved in cell wall biosynthesis
MAIQTKTLKRINHLNKNIHNFISQLKKWGIDLVYSNSSVLDIGIICANIIKKPHIWHLREFGDLDYGITPDIGKPLFKKLLCSSDALIFISNSLKEHLLPSFKHPNSAVIYNGVAHSSLLNDFFRISKKNSKPNIKTFSIVGLVTETKGQHVAISSFVKILNNFPDARLYIAGNGNMLAQLKSFVYRAHLYDNIIFLNEIVEPLGLFMNTDVALVCSNHEAMGRVTAESMSCLCPVIGKNSGATPELIDHGHTGFLYDTPDELTNYMIKSIKNPQMIRTMGKNAWEKAVKNFTVEEYINKIIDLINSLHQSSDFTKKTEIFGVNTNNDEQLNNDPYWSFYNKFIDLDSVTVSS